MKKYFVDYNEVEGLIELKIEMHRALKKEFGNNNEEFIKELMIENVKSLNEVGRNNINGVEFEVQEL